MNKYKLYNTIKKELLSKDGINRGNIQLKRFSYSLLRELFQKYAIQEYVVSQYCCYGEDQCCWQDVEGENIGWILMQKGGISRHFAIEKSLYNSLKPYKKGLYNRKVFYVDLGNFIWVQIPLRDIAKEDYSIVFDKTRPVKDLLNNKR